MANTETKAVRAAKTAADATDKVASTTSSAADKAAATTRNAAKEMTDAAFAYPTLEVPEAFRSFAEQGLTQTREAYSRMKAATEEATDLLEDSFETTRESLRDAQYKALEATQANVDATFDFFRKLIGATSVSEAVQLQTTFTRERFEAFVEQSKDVQETFGKVSAEAAKPARALFDRALTQAKAA